MALAAALSSTPALAQHDLDRGVALYEAADLEGALATLERAERGEDLTRSDLIRLLATRALVLFALDRSEPMLADLTALASLAPEHDLGDRAPPAVREAFDRARARVREPLSVRAVAHPLAAGVRVSAEVRGDRGALVRAVRVRARAPGGSFRAGRDAVVLPTLADAVEVVVEVVGPGGAVLASDGADDAPRRLTVARGVDSRATDQRRDPALAVGLAAGAAVLVAAAVVLALVLAGGGRDTVLVGPSLETAR